MVMKQLTKKEQLIGKTIKEVKRANDIPYQEFAHLILIFDDDTYVGIEGGHEYEDSYAEIVMCEPNMRTKWILEFVTQADYDNHEAQKKAEHIKEADIRSRAEYERLKKRFEKE